MRPPQICSRDFLLIDGRLQRYGARRAIHAPKGSHWLGGASTWSSQPPQRRKCKKGWNHENGEASSHVRFTAAVEGEMALHFSRVGPAAEELEIWSASECGFSFVVSNESRDGPGLHGKPGFVASWRPIHINKPAIRVGGSPFKTFAEAETACEAMLGHLTR